MFVKFSEKISVNISKQFFDVILSENFNVLLQSIHKFFFFLSFIDKSVIQNLITISQNALNFLSVRFFDIIPKIFIQFINWTAQNFFNNIVSCFWSYVLKFFNFFFFVSTNYDLKLTLNFILVWLNVVAPARTVNYKLRALFHKLANCCVVQLLRVFYEIFVNLIPSSEFSNLFLGSIKNRKSYHFELIIKSNIKFLHNRINHFLFHFFENSGLILTSVGIKICHSLFDNLITLLFKICNFSIFRITLKLLNLVLNFVYCFFFNFAASILCNHFSLIR